MEHSKVLAVLDMNIPFEEQIQNKRAEAEHYSDQPFINIPQSAWALPDITKLLAIKPKAPFLKVVHNGDAPEI